jgi:hypothetical protein
VAAIFRPIKAAFPLMNGRGYNVSEEIVESKWEYPPDGYKLYAYQSGRSLWNLMRIGRNFSCCQPCSGHSSLRGDCFAPGTGLATSSAPHLAHFIVAESFSTG